MVCSLPSGFRATYPGRDSTTVRMCDDGEDNGFRMSGGDVNSIDLLLIVPWETDVSSAR